MLCHSRSTFPRTLGVWTLFFSLFSILKRLADGSCTFRVAYHILHYDWMSFNPLTTHKTISKSFRRTKRGLSILCCQKFVFSRSSNSTGFILVFLSADMILISTVVNRKARSREKGFPLICEKASLYKPATRCFRLYCYKHIFCISTHLVSFSFIWILTKHVEAHKKGTFTVRSVKI